MIRKTFAELVELGARAKWEEKRRLHNLGSPFYILPPWENVVENVKQSQRDDVQLILLACGIENFCKHAQDTFVRKLDLQTNPSNNRL